MSPDTWSVLVQAIEGATPEQCPELMGQLERLKASLWLRMTTGNQRAVTLQQDQLLTAEEVADRLHCSTDYVYRHAKRFPFMVREGRNVRFSERGLERYIQQRQGRRTS
jgi:excisionase family DNA binding protein